MTEQVFQLIEQKDRLSLERFLDMSLKVPLVDLVDHRGYTALHLACFKGFDEIAKILIEHVK